MDEFAQGPHRYISSLEFYCEGEALEQAQDLTNQVIEWAESNGMKLIDGTTSLVREREAIESVTYASTEIFRNRVGEQQASVSHATSHKDKGREQARA